MKNTRECVINLIKKHVITQKTVNYSSPTISEQINIENIVANIRKDFLFAPIGNHIFSLIESKYSLRFEFEDFENESIKCIIVGNHNEYINDYVVINKNQPLIEQIFAACYALYKVDFRNEIAQDTEIVKIDGILNEIDSKAFYFACECLIPKQQLIRELRDYLVANQIDKFKLVTIRDWARVCYSISIKYGIPLKYLLTYVYYLEAYNLSYILSSMELEETIIATSKCLNLFMQKELLSEGNNYVNEAFNFKMQEYLSENRMEKNEIQKDLIKIGLSNII